MEQIVADLVASLRQLDALDAPIAAAYLDSAIDALCRAFGVTRDSSKSD